MSFLWDSTHTWDIWVAVSPSAPMKSMARAEEMLRGERNTFREWSSSPNIFNKVMAKVPFASPRSSIREGLHQRHNPEAHQPDLLFPHLVPRMLGVVSRVTTPPKMSTSNSPTCDYIPSCGTRDFAAGIELGITRWGDAPGGPRWAHEITGCL